jgi:hypothetical protein
MPPQPEYLAAALTMPASFSAALTAACRFSMPSAAAAVFSPRPGPNKTAKASGCTLVDRRAGPEPPDENSPLKITER